MKVWNDFKVFEFYSTLQPGVQLWQVRTGYTDVVTTCRSKEEAERIAERLNKDPYYLGRGMTQSDRANGQTK